jgi:hypothetical protein
MTKNYLKVIKDICFRLSLCHLKPCMSRSWTGWSRWISLVECSRSIFDLTIVCVFLPFPSSGDVVNDRQWKVQTLSAAICAGAHRWCIASKKVFISRAR